MASYPLVSVVMITYNHEQYIAQAIKSVLRQKTSFSFELVIGEDCSTDNTREIVSEYQNKYPDVIRVITAETNVGMHSNALRVEYSCRGKYIAYCEGDDHWHNPHKLQMQVDFLETYPDYVMVHGDHARCNVQTATTVNSCNNDHPQYDDGNAYFDILTTNRKICTLTVCVRKEALCEAVRNNPECANKHYKMGDLQRWLEVSRLGKVKYFNVSLGTYNVLMDSAVHGLDPNKEVQFDLSAKEIRYHYLSKYDCPKEVAVLTKYNCINGVLSSALRARNIEVVNSQLSELRAMNLQPSWTWKDYLVYLGCRYKRIGALQLWWESWSLRRLARHFCLLKTGRSGEVK